MKRKTVDADDEIVGFLGDAEQFFGAEHAFECGHKGRQRDGKRDVVQEPTKIFQRIRNALQKVRLALIKAAKTVCAERLEDADVDVGVVVLQKSVAIDFGEFGDGIKIVIEKLLAKFGRKIGFGIEEERGQIVLERAFAAALIVEEIRLSIAKHDVAGLEVAIEKIVAVGGEKKFGETIKIVFERLFVEGNAGEAKKIVFEIVEIPNDGLAVETAAGITDGIIQVAAGFDLKARQNFDDFSIDVGNGGRDRRASAIFGEEMEKGGIAEIFFDVSALVDGVAIDFGNGKAVAAKVAGKFEEGEIFFANVIENADGGRAGAAETDDLATGAAELALERYDTLGGFMKMGFEEAF